MLFDATYLPLMAYHTNDVATCAEEQGREKDGQCRIPVHFPDVDAQFCFQTTCMPALPGLCLLRHKSLPSWCSNSFHLHCAHHAPAIPPCRLPTRPPPTRAHHSHITAAAVRTFRVRTRDACPQPSITPHAPARSRTRTPTRPRSRLNAPTLTTHSPWRDCSGGTLGAGKTPRCMPWFVHSRRTWTGRFRSRYLFYAPIA